MSSPPLRGRRSWHRSVTRGESRTTRDTPEVRVGTEQERGRRELGAHGVSRAGAVAFGD